jgi:hypothetical protein
VEESEDRVSVACLLRGPTVQTNDTTSTIDGKKRARSDELNNRTNQTDPNQRRDGAGGWCKTGDPIAAVGFE